MARLSTRHVTTHISPYETVQYLNISHLVSGLCRTACHAPRGHVSAKPQMTLQPDFTPHIGAILFSAAALDEHSAVDGVIEWGDDPRPPSPPPPSPPPPSPSAPSPRRLLGCRLRGRRILVLRQLVIQSHHEASAVSVPCGGAAPAIPITRVSVTSQRGRRRDGVEEHPRCIA